MIVLTFLSPVIRVFTFHQGTMAVVMSVIVNSNSFTATFLSTNKLILLKNGTNLFNIFARIVGNQTCDSVFTFLPSFRASSYPRTYGVIINLFSDFLFRNCSNLYVLPFSNPLK